MANLPLMPDKARRESVRLDNSTGTTAQQILIAGAEGGFIEALTATSNHTVSGGVWITVLIGRSGGTQFNEVAVLVPAISGGSPLSRITIFHPSTMPELAYTNNQYRLGGGDIVSIKAESALPIGTFIDVTAKYGEYPV